MNIELNWEDMLKMEQTKIEIDRALVGVGGLQDGIKKLKAL